ncbi:MAG: hypothetical protein IJX78_03145 [Bacilli bacterium]|nr:hypothetical protein [Bacilli bacterium]
MKNKISSQIMYYFNMIIFGIGFANSTYLSLVMNKDAKHSWIIPLFILIIFLFLMLFAKKNFSNYQKLKNNLIIKIIIGSYSLLSIILLSFFTSIILTSWFYEESSIFVFIIIMISIVMVLGLFKTTSIIRVGFAWSLCYILIALFGLSIHNESNILFLFPIELSKSTLINNLFFLILPLDNLIYFFIDKPENDYPSKKTIVISSAITLIMCTIQAIVNLTLVNYRFYDGLQTSAIEAFFMYYSKNHIGHYDIVLIINVLMTFLYKGSLYANLTLNCFKEKKKILIIPFIVLLCIPITFKMIYYQELKFIITNIIFILILLLFICIIYFQRRLEND